MKEYDPDKVYSDEELAEAWAHVFQMMHEKGLWKKLQNRVQNREAS